MDFWLAIVIIVVVGSVMETVRQSMKRKDRGNVKYDQALSDFDARIERQEQRIRNIETVILEMDKDRVYQNLGRSDQ